MTDFDNLRVVLVAARNPLNIGAAARAMSNFGVKRLRVVNPYERAFREARSAVGAADLLAKAEEYASVGEAVADCKLVVGTTAAGPRRELQHRLLRLEDGAHDFLRGRKLLSLPAAAPRHKLVQPGGMVTVTIEPIPDPGATRHPAIRELPGRKPQHAPAAAGSIPHAAQGALLLLVRFVREDIGPIPLDIGQAGEISLHVSASLGSAEIPAGKRHVPVAEWRLTADDGTQVPWPAFPAVAEALADWVQQQAAAHPDHTILLAARMPQEIAVGLGIQLGQRSASWPLRVYPVHYTGECLVVPDLDLGRGSVPAERK